MTPFEMQTLERHLHLLDDMRLRALRRDAGGEKESAPGTRHERAEALQVAWEAVRDRFEAANREAAKDGKAA
jgi:hypothetical protein